MKGKGSLRSGGFLCFLCKFCCYQLFVGNPGIQFTRFFKNILQQLKEEKTSMLGIFHDLEFMEGVCDKVFNMSEGSFA